MGISGLLQFIKDAAEPVNVKKYKGQTVAVDTYCWLHKGAFSCAEKLAKGEPTDQYVWYCMKFVDMLLTFSVKPILVFDGRNLPSKQEVEKARRERRETNLQKGRQLLREGKLSEARECFNRCVNITPAMAHNLIKAARARGVDCVVAPYEADAQLAYLSKSGLAQAVITEDSDLLAFGCKKVILKMDKQGNGLEIDQSNLGRCRSLGNVFTEEKFRYMCILSGCDYLASLHGIGLGKACKLLQLAKDPDILRLSSCGTWLPESRAFFLLEGRLCFLLSACLFKEVIRKMGQYLKMSLVVPEQYIEGFVRANNTFLYQLVFDPVRRKVVPLNPYPEHIDPATLSYAGLHLGDDKGLQMALGNLDINSMERIDDFSPDKPIPQQCKSRSHSWNYSPASTGPSIWSRGFTPATAAPARPPTSPDRPPSTRGKKRVINLDGLRIPCRELQTQVYRTRMCCRSTLHPAQSAPGQTSQQTSPQSQACPGHATYLPLSCRGGTRKLRRMVRSHAADSSAVPQPLRSPHPAFRTVTLRVQMARLWKPPSHLHHPVPPVQPVVASAYFAGQTARQLNNLARHCPPQACLRCSSSSIKRKAVHLHQRSPDPLEIRFYQSPSPRTENQRRMSSQTPLPPRTALISPSHSPTSLPTIKRKPPPTASPPPTRRMLLRKVIQAKIQR
ncbi:exonuclease 1 isoform X3 [Astatotilapia calliptera]|uniref:exonuclease 1 isoform X3 n=1 Tax=Astatotilapia calliptera TaxID=8154 RepID=UPI000E403089|nr:exonuclease 1 isoform X3 [Astatotilapia calliptera]